MENEETKYTIKEVSKLLHVQVGKLKEWETLFPTALDVQRTKTGARLYTDLDLETLKKIRILKEKQINDENVRFILDTRNEMVPADGNEPSQDYINKLLETQTNTSETVQSLNNSFKQLKEEVVQEMKREIRKELHVRQNQTKSLVQSFSHMIMETTEHTHDEITRLRQEIYKEEEEKLFIQHKLEEREEQFQEFVLAYRESAATKQRLPNWLKIFKWKKEGSVDFSKM